MSQFVPIVRIAAALERAGHEVAAILTDVPGQEKAQKTLELHGIKAKLMCPVDQKIKEDGFASMELRMNNRVVDDNVKAVHDLEPDLIIGDWYSVYPLLVADKAQVPIVVNVPNTLTPLSLMLVPTIKGSDETCCCCGCMCLRPSYTRSCILCCSGAKPELMNLLATVKNRYILCNSFFGLDQAVCLPPNVTMTGPLS